MTNCQNNFCLHYIYMKLKIVFLWESVVFFQIASCVKYFSALLYAIFLFADDRV